jgi:ammonia channel protein AmtB
MIPGVGFFYSGLARRKSALSLIWLSMMSTAVVSFQVRGAAPKINNSLVMETVVEQPY